MSDRYDENIEQIQNQEENFKNWSEGNEYLYELFKSCSKKNIKTASSCGGHDNKQAVPFISIILDDSSFPYISNIIDKINNIDNSWVAYHFNLPFEREEWSPENISKSFQIYGTNTNCCELFYKLNKAISQKPKTFNETPNDFIKKLKDLYAKTEEDLYELLLHNNGEISEYLGEKDRILSEISHGKHNVLQKEFYEGEIFPSDIVEADMARKIPQTKIEQIKNFFHRIIDKIQGTGER